METTEEIFKAAKRALSEGENFQAYDLAERIPDGPDGPSPQKVWVQALALARSGSLHRAQELAEKLPDAEDSDLAGLKSRIYKDLAGAERDSARRRAFFLEAATRSLDIFRKKRAWYNGINAASCLRMAGRAEEARRLALDEVLPLCKAETRVDMWLEATLGECHLLLADLATAAGHYSRAARMALESGTFGDFGSTLRQLKMLSTSFADGAAELWQRIALPSVCVFAGHRMDVQGTDRVRFSAASEEGVRRRIVQSLQEHNVALGYASCANGGDILFLESVLAAGGYVWVVPPFPLETTIRCCVADAPGNWVSRLHAIVSNPHASLLEPECDVTGEGDEIAYDFTNRYTLGLARLKARAINLPLIGLSVWDGQPSGNVGSTYAAIRLWEASGLPYDVVRPDV